MTDFARTAIDHLYLRHPSLVLTVYADGSEGTNLASACGTFSAEVLPSGIVIERTLIAGAWARAVFLPDGSVDPAELRRATTLPE